MDMPEVSVHFINSTWWFSVTACAAAIVLMCVTRRSNGVGSSGSTNTSCYCSFSSGLYECAARSAKADTHSSRDRPLPPDGTSRWTCMKKKKMIT